MGYLLFPLKTVVEKVGVRMGSIIQGNMQKWFNLIFLLFRQGRLENVHFILNIAICIVFYIPLYILCLLLEIGILES